MTDLDALRRQIAATTSANVALAVRLEKSAAWLDRSAGPAEERAIDHHAADLRAALGSLIPRDTLASLVARYLAEA